MPLINNIIEMKIYKILHGRTFSFQTWWSCPVEQQKPVYKKKYFSVFWEPLPDKYYMTEWEKYLNLFLLSSLWTLYRFLLGCCFSNCMMISCLCSMISFLQNSLNFSETKFVPASDIIFLCSPFSTKIILEHVIRPSANTVSAHVTTGNLV